jgi:hypothetical protein
MAGNMTKIVGVCCGTSSGDEKIHEEESFKLGKTLAEKHYKIRYGGGNKGIMKALTKGYEAGLADANSAGMEACISKAYSSDAENLGRYPFCSVTLFENEIERLHYITALSDITILGPGGIGTIAEGLGNVASQLAHSYCNEFSKHTILFDTGNLYTPLRMQFLQAIVSGFAKPEVSKMIHHKKKAEDVVNLVDTLEPVLLERISSVEPNQIKNERQAVKQELVPCVI